MRALSVSLSVCARGFFLYLAGCGVVFSLPQSSTITMAMQIVGVQSLDKMADCLGLFSAAQIFFLNRGFSAVGVFSPEEGVGPPPLNHTHWPLPWTFMYTCTCSCCYCLVVM